MNRLILLSRPDVSFFLLNRQFCKSNFSSLKRHSFHPKWVGLAKLVFITSLKKSRNDSIHSILYFSSVMVDGRHGRKLNAMSDNKSVLKRKKTWFRCDNTKCNIKVTSCSLTFYASRRRGSRFLNCHLSRHATFA